MYHSMYERITVHICVSQNIYVYYSTYICIIVHICVPLYIYVYQLNDLLFTQLKVKTFLFQTIQFSIIVQFSSIWTIDRTLSGAITPGQSGPGSNGNKGVLCIPRSSSISGTSPSDCLVSYPFGNFEITSSAYIGQPSADLETVLTETTRKHIVAGEEVTETAGYRAHTSNFLIGPCTS